MSRFLPRSGSRSMMMMAAVVLGSALTAGAATATEPRVEPKSIDAISRYCQACWRNARLPADRWADCTQQVFTRLLESLPPDHWTAVLAADGDERKEFHRAIDAVKKRTQRTRKLAPLTPDYADGRTNDGDELRDRREALANAAVEVLSTRQQRIVELTAGGWAVPDIAVELGTSVARVSDEKYKAIRKLRSVLAVV